jgi:hypothetical protein
MRMQRLGEKTNLLKVADTIKLKLRLDNPSFVNLTTLLYCQ